MLCERNLDDSIDSGNFSVRGYLPLIQKDSGTHMHGLTVYVKEGLPFARDLSLENSRDSYLFSTGFTSLSVLLLFHHKDWLTYSSGTDRAGELCYNFSISNDLIQMVHFPTRIPDCGSHSPALLDLFISSDASIFSMMAFAPLGNSDHVVALVSIDFPTNSQQDAPFHRIAILVLIGMVFVII